MFIGNQFLKNSEIFDLEKNFSFETSLGLYHKLKNKGYQIVLKEGLYGVTNESNSIFFPYTYSADFINQKCQIFKSPDEAYLTLGRKINNDKLSIALLFLQEFHNHKFSKIFKDKNGQEFQIDLVENYELNFDSLHTHNMILVSRNKQKIGYLHSYYMNKENIVKNFDSLSEYLLFKQNKYPHNFEELKSLTKDILNIDNISENLSEKEFILETNNLLKRKLILNEKRENKLFLNLATTYYSRLLEEEQGKGIAQFMYLETAKYYNSIGIDFRSSVCLTADSQKVWQNIQKNFPNQVSIRKINDQNIFIFTPHNSDFLLQPKIHIKRKTTM